MKQLFIVLFFFSIYLYTAQAESFVKELTHKNFVEKVKQGTWFIQIYSPHCGFCHMLAPTWEEFATTHKNEINVAKINGQEEDELASLFEVKGYPSLFLVKDGKRYSYLGDRALRLLKEFAIDGGYQKTQGVPLFKKEAAEESTNLHILTDSNFDLLTSSGTWFIKFYTPWCGWCQKMKPDWEEFANQQKDNKGVYIGKIDCSVHSKIPSRFSIRGYPTLILIKNGKYSVYNGGRTVQDFTYNLLSEPTDTLPQGSNAPAVRVVADHNKRQEGIELTNGNFAEFTSKGHWLVTITSSNCPLCDDTSTFIKEYLTKYPKLNHGHIDAIANPGLMKMVSFHAGVPTGHIVYAGRTWMYPGTLGQKPELFDRFLNNYRNFQNKELPPTIRSGDAISSKDATPIPGTNPTFGVPKETFPTPLVYKDQSREINNGTMIDLIGGGDWLLEFYAPWCGHCKHFEPVWTETTNVNIGVNYGKIDCDAQSFICTQAFIVPGYPTIIYIKNGGMYTYDGERDKDSIVEFMKNGYKSAEKKSLEVPINVISFVHQYNVEENAKVAPLRSVVELHDDNFESKTRYGIWAVLFYASDNKACPGCANARKEFAKLAKDSNGLFFVGQIDSIANKFTSMKYSHQKLPRVLIFSGDNTFVYSDKLDSVSLKLFIGQGISSYQPISRSSLDPSGTASFFVHQISLSAFDYQQVIDYLNNHTLLLYSAFFVFAFIVGVFFGINMASGALKRKYNFIISGYINQINQLKKNDPNHNKVPVKGENVVKKDKNDKKHLTTSAPFS